MGSVQQFGVRALRNDTQGVLAAGLRRARDLCGVDSFEAHARLRTLSAVAHEEASEVLGLDAAIWAMFGEIRGVLGRRIGHDDTWTAAAALATNRLLVTQDALLAERYALLPQARTALVPRDQD